MSVPTMDRTDSSAAMASLANYADPSDSEEEEGAGQVRSAVDNISDEDAETPTPTPTPISNSAAASKVALEQDNDSRSSEGPTEKPKPRKKKTRRLVSYGADELEESSSSSEEDDTQSSDKHGSFVIEGKIVSSSLNVEQASSLSRSMLNKSFDEIELPPEPLAKCNKRLQEKIASLHEKRKREGTNLNNTIQRRKDFRNPSIYEKLIEFCGIDEKGTNYPPELFDPYSWGKESYYDGLDKAQKLDMEKREKERKERTKVEFVTGTKKTKTDASVIPDEKKRKTKWDSEVSSHTRAGNVVAAINQGVVANLTASATGTKTTVIPATGSITRKSK